MGEGGVSTINVVMMLGVAIIYIVVAREVVIGIVLVGLVVSANPIANFFCHFANKVSFLSTIEECCIDQNFQFPYLQKDIK